MAKKQVIVIGAGLFGSIAATLARAHGHDVTVVDAARPWAASKASGCVLAPSWLSALDRTQIDTGMGVLEELYQVERVDFRGPLGITFKAHRIDPRKVLLTPDFVDVVQSVSSRGVRLERAGDLRGVVLVAAGIESHKLLPQIPVVKGLWGASLRIQGQLDEPRIHVYAPYRQAVAFNLDRRSVWMGDGTSLVESTWQKTAPERVAQTTQRAAELFRLTGKTSVAIGARPSVAGYKAGLFAKVMPNVWVSTGGAKNGTMLAAWQAHQFLQELNRA